ncbi:PucR family transcriptional regulator [Actinobacteria bacterium YIM 96077]|uniref:PucR family transcriptional regulator n=1 Tax=Phytoactinopolyspora halophila TaxID=1981511 RepID=A0A329QZX4_9ACTN|nr:PucR family transcriptional regulator ligand-binding domain-containing protein [Phytoactinopolyspora halophila]AYY11657.1 PucR family transcriptional regulator [Actinobacteria bacterium YIM 96077]RAW17910.1 hypothetical protein DPM12_03415 [Phytoactinopolyspora halophila]
MAMTVRDILALPAVRAAEPRLMTRPEGLDRAVTWAHSSEIFEIGPLLAGGELLLTTGLGLSGADAGARRHWIRELTHRGVVAIAIEVGRSLPALPEELVDEAERCDLPLVRLDEVVPFERICRDVNTVLVDQDGAALRIADQLSDRLLAALAKGGLAAVARAATEQLGQPVVIATAAGQAVAVAGVPSKRVLDNVIAAAAAHAPVIVDEHVWGHVFTGEPAADAHLPAGAPQQVARRIAAAAAVAVAHLGDSTAESGSAAVALLEDLLAGSAVSEHELVVRAGLAGLHTPEGAAVLGIAANAPDPVSIIAAVRAAGSRTGGALVGRVGGQVLAVVAAAKTHADPAGDVVAALTEHYDTGPELTCVVGPPVTLAEAGRSLREAQASVECARPGMRTWRETVAQRLVGMLDRTAREHLIDDLLGPLRRWDSAHGSDLIRTVDVYLRHGRSPTRAADVLHVRRQSLHQRLQRAEALLGHRLDDPEIVTALLLAVHAAR